MKKYFYFAAALLLAATTVTSCSSDNDEEKDIDVVGNIALSGKFQSGDDFYPNTNGWTDEHKVGVFVLSDGYPQNNIPYVPSETTPYETMEFNGLKIKNYSNSDVVLETTLKATSTTVAGFKAGKHTLYAYIPYNAEATDLKAVPLPNLATQTYDPNLVFGADKKNFIYTATATTSSYSAATLSFGEFKPLCSELNISAMEFPDEAGDKVVTKLVITADQPIAYEDGATLNLETGVITGKAVNTITVNAPTGIVVNAGMSFGSFSLPASMETVHLVIPVTFDKAKDYTYTVTATVDGKEYKASGKMSTTYVATGNVNLNGFAAE